MKKVVGLAVDAGVATEVPKDEGGLGFAAKRETTRPNPLENLTMPAYDGNSVGTFTEVARYTKKDAIAGYLNQFAAKNPEFKGVFTGHGSVVEFPEGGSPKFKGDFITALNDFIANAHVEEGSTEGRAMERDLIGDFRQAVLKRVQAAGAEPLNLRIAVESLLSSSREDVSTLRDNLLSQPPDVIKGVITRLLEPTDDPALRQRDISIARYLDGNLSSLYEKGGDITIPPPGFPIGDRSARVDINVVAQVQSNLQKLILPNLAITGKVNAFRNNVITLGDTADKLVVMKETLSALAKENNAFFERLAGDLKIPDGDGGETVGAKLKTAVTSLSDSLTTLDTQINTFVEEFLNGGDDWRAAKDAKLTELSGEDAPPGDLLAQNLKLKLGAEIMGKIMALADLEDETSKGKLKQAQKILTEEFNQAGHPDLDADLTYTPVSFGEEAKWILPFTVNFSIKEHSQGVAWAMTQLGDLGGERNDYFDASDKLKKDNLKQPEGTGSTYWDSEAGKAALAYFEAGLGAKFPKGSASGSTSDGYVELP